jgi:hypothetical protein
MLHLCVAILRANTHFLKNIECAFQVTTFTRAYFD